MSLIVAINEFADALAAQGFRDDMDIRCSKRDLRILVAEMVRMDISRRIHSPNTYLDYNAVTVRTSSGAICFAHDPLLDPVPPKPKVAMATIHAWYDADGGEP